MARVLAGGPLSGGACSTPIQWQAHSRLNCTICKSYSDKSKPEGAPKGKAHHQRPHAPISSTPTATPSYSTDNISLEKESGMDVSMDEIEQRAMPAYKANFDLDRERFLDKM